MGEGSLTNHPDIRKANSASSSKIQHYVPLRQVVKGIQYQLHARRVSEFPESVRMRIWTMFESNMKSIYEASDVFPWIPPDKRKQMFHKLARFVLATYDSNIEDLNLLKGEDILAYCIFRFERDEGRNVLYVYELQAADTARRLGLGRVLINNLNSVGKGFGMSAMMLTHLKVNVTAKPFYDSLNFKIDVSSPDYVPQGVRNQNELAVDEGYSILSRTIQ